MATTITSSSDYFSRSARPSVLGSARGLTPGAGAGAGGTTPGSPRTPRTPLLNRSISSQFGSPGSGLRAEPEDVIVYELHERYICAGYAGESRPRCFVRFSPEGGRRVGDWRQYDYSIPKKENVRKQTYGQWAGEHELYRADLRSLDLGLVEDKLDRAVRVLHTDHLQLDQKPRKAVLVTPSLFPTPLLEVALKVLFSHFSQPPSVVLLTKPVMNCVAAGLRHGLVVEVGWEETVVTAVGEYKEVLQRRTVRGGKMLVQETKKLLDEAAGHYDNGKDGIATSYDDAEQVTDRMIYCRSSSTPPNDDQTTTTLPLSSTLLAIPFTSLSLPAETTFFPQLTSHPDDHEAPLPSLLYQTLLALPLELRALCLRRLILTGSHSRLPGLKARLLRELQTHIATHGWDSITNYGSATGKKTSQHLRDRAANASEVSNAPQGRKVSAQPSDPIAPLLPPASERKHDDLNDRITLKAEKERRREGNSDGAKAGEVRGVESLGAWAGASLTASLRVKGVWEVEREEFSSRGLRGEGMGLL
ncbi:hypothetical protein MBLNU230_g3911t1 [Neophaeotheca triangularis]